MTAAERSAIGLADKFAMDHLSVGDADFHDLRAHFSEKQIMDLCSRLAGLVGFGRMAAILDIVDDLPEEYTSQEQGSAAPW